MIRYLFCLLSLLIIVDLSLTHSVVAMGNDSESGMVPGIVVVKFSEAIGDQKAATPFVEKMMARHGGVELDPVLPAEVLFASKRAVALSRVFYFRYRDGAAPRTVAAEWQRNEGVDYAEPLFIHRFADAAADPDDPLFADMTHLQQVQAPAAWDVVKGDEGDVLVAIVDGGTDWRHVDLIDNVWTNPNEIDGNGLDDDSNGFVDDIHGWNFLTGQGDPTPGSFSNVHGTTVAGVAVAATNNGQGIAGMSWNASFMSIHAGCAETGNTICSGYPGILYAAANGADIINASFSRDGEASRFEQEIIDFAYEQGALVVAAADNSNVNSDIAPRFPANYNRVLSVGATNKANDQKASFSNFGRTVDVFAPGVSLNSTQPGNIYTNFANGTSFASPLVAGLAALVKTQHPGWSVDQVREQIRTTTDPIDDANPNFVGLMGRGRVNALRAVTESGSPAIRLVGFTVSDSDGNGEINSSERIDVSLALTNYLADADQVSLDIGVDDPLVTLAQNTAVVGGLATGDTARVQFSFDLDAATPDQHTLVFTLTIRATASTLPDGYSDVALVRLVANPPRLADHDTGVVQTTITSTGNIGWTGFAGSSFGSGFVYNGSNLLFEGGLLVGMDESAVSDNVRSPHPNGRDQDFDIAPGTQVELVQPGGLAFQQGEVSWVDTGAEMPLSILVRQETFADTAATRDDFVIFKYTISNQTATPLDNIYAGLFFDWDLNSNALDYSRYDTTRRLSVLQNTAQAPTVLAGSQLLTKHTGLSYRAIHNNDELFEDGFLEVEKWRFLSGGLQTQSLDNTDISTLLSAGPYTILPECPVEVAFAVLGGGNLAGMQAAADAAQAYWDTSLQINRANQPPVFANAIADTSVGHVDILSLTLAATDPDPCDTVTYRLIQAPTNATLDSGNGGFSFDPDASQIGSHPVTLVATDGELADTLRFSITVFSPVSNEQTDESLSFELGASYPNPGTFPVAIPYVLSDVSTIQLQVFDLLGREVQTLVDSEQARGQYTAIWEGKEYSGRAVASGVYLYRLTAQTPHGQISQTRRLVVLR